MEETNITRAGQDTNQVTINGVSYPVSRARFKKFLILEDLRGQIVRATGASETASLIVSYVSVALNAPKDSLSKAPWKDVAVAYVEIVTENIIAVRLPFLKRRSASENEQEAWDYAGRMWFSMAHLFCKEYGWTLDTVSNLEVDDALHLLQEIYVSQQLEKEWEWSRSPNSIGYDQASQKSKFIELPRPEWMMKPVAPPKKVKILRSMLPQGLVLNPDGSHATFGQIT